MLQEKLETKISLSDPYYNYCGFLTQDNATMKTLRRAMHCIERRSEIVWVEGEAGTGKHLLCNAIIREHGRHCAARAYITGSYVLEAEATLSSLSRLLQSGIEALRIYFSPTAAVEQIIALQEHLALQLGARQKKLSLLCFISRTASHYHPSVAQHLGVIKPLFVEHHFEYMSLQPLHHRRADMALLLRHYIDEFSGVMLREPPECDGEALSLLDDVAFTNNVRDIQRLALMLAQSCKGASGRVTVQEMRQALGQVRGDEPLQSERRPSFLSASPMVHLLDESGNVRPMVELESDIVTMACRYHRGSKSSAARDLGMGRTTLYRKLRQSEKI